MLVFDIILMFTDMVLS